MAWIEIHEELRTHPKVSRLARELGVSKAESRGLVIGLLCWTTTYAPDGDISRVDSRDLADGCDYEGEKDFKAALVAARWVDQDGDRYVVHDWDEMGLKMLTAAQARQKRYRERVDAAAGTRESKSASDVPQSAPETPERENNVTVTSPKRNGDVTVPSYLTLPNHNHTRKAEAEDPRKAEKPPAAAAVPEPPKPESPTAPRNPMALVTELAQSKQVLDFSWLPGMLIQEWGKDGRVGYGVQERLVELGKKHGPDRLRYAIREAAKHNARTEKYVERVLEPKVKPDDTGNDKIKRCRACGHKWDWDAEIKRTGSSLCPICYPCGEVIAEG